MVDILSWIGERERLEPKGLFSRSAINKRIAFLRDKAALSATRPTAMVVILLKVSASVMSCSSTSMDSPFNALHLQNALMSIVLSVKMLRRDDLVLVKSVIILASLASFDSFASFIVISINLYMKEEEENNIKDREKVGKN
jgi:hypothetical protein